MMAVRAMRFLFCSVMLLTFLYSSLVLADCSRYSGASTVHWDNINLGTILVQRDAPVGTLLSSQMLTSSQNGELYVSCVGSGTFPISASILRASSGVLDGVYESGVAGVGIKATDIGTSGSRGTVYSNPPATGTIGPGNINVRMGQGVLLEVFKTGPITSGTVTTGKLFSRTYGSYESLYGTLVGGQIQQLACTLNQTTVNVNLGDWMTTDFSAPGSVSSPRPVNIGLNCDSGTRVNVNIQGDADTAQPGTLKLTPDANVATGVGVQILDQNGAPVTLNSKYLLATTSTTGNYTINWQARYIQTGSAVTSGPANAQATVAISYE